MSLATVGEKLFGFNTDQKKSLKKFLADYELQGLEFAALRQQVDKLSARVKVLEGHIAGKVQARPVAQSNKD